MASRSQLAFFAVVSSIVPISAAAYNRCDKADGTHYFTDDACKPGDKQQSFDKSGNQVYKGPTSPRIGMHADDVLGMPYPWGQPTRRNRDITAEHVREQWVYPLYYLYFVDGVLTS